MMLLVPGCPGSGKSTLCRAVAHALVDASGRPLLVVDPEHRDIWADIQHRETVADVLRDLYVWGRHVAWSDCEGLCSHPACKEPVPKVEHLLAGVKAARGTIVILDEVHYLATAHRISPGLKHLAQDRRGAQADILANTQRLADLHQDLLGAVDLVAEFRLTAPADQETSVKRWGADASALPAYQFILVKVGFEVHDLPAPLLRARQVLAPAASRAAPGGASLAPGPSPERVPSEPSAGGAPSERGPAAAA